ncbi:DeoR family transcriptional regulator [Flavobacteriaceae bacterium W22]|nr:DeoR family transcriptional regulator [Flavobacteriaceae bacterium W22]
MENSNLKNLVQKGQSNTLAFLEDLDLDQIAIILSSLLNHKGGNLIVGVTDSGKLKGISNQYSLNEIKSFLINSIVPESPIEIFEELINDNSFLIFKVWEGTRQPYIFNGNIYYRKGKFTDKADSQELSVLIHDRQKNELHWERQASLGFEWEDLDLKGLRSVMTDAKANNRSSYQGEDELEFLSHYGLFNNGSFSNACIVLFAKNPGQFLPQTRVRLTEYPSNKTGDSLVRDEVIEGNLFVIRERLEKFVSGMGTKSIFSHDEWKRHDFKYPVKALQEGIINALIHRDYSRFNSHLTISIYPGSFVIANSGNLPEEMKIADLRKNHRSFPANPDIAQIVFLLGYIDKLGRGTVKIIEECKASGLREPKWTNKSNEVVLTFYGPVANIGSKSDKTVNNTKDTYVINDAVDDAVNDAVDDAVNDAVNDAVKTRLKYTVKLIYTQDSVSLKDLVAHFDSSRATIQRDLLLLNAVNIITRIGSDKYREYALNDALKKQFDALKK